MIVEFLLLGGIVVREIVSNALQGDIPFAAIKKIELVAENLVRFSTIGSSRFAMKFKNKVECSHFYDSLSHMDSIPQHLLISNICSKNRTSFPNLNDPNIQELLLRLLFTEGFDEFVTEIQDLCQGFNLR